MKKNVTKLVPRLVAFLIIFLIKFEILVLNEVVNIRVIRVDLKLLNIFSRD